MNDKLRTCAWGLGLSLVVVGCGETGDRVDNRLDCRQICDRYAECIDEDYDVDACRDNCRESANDDEDFESRVEECGNCIEGDESCVEQSFQCATECVGIVP